MSAAPTGLWRLAAEPEHPSTPANHLGSMRRPVGSHGPGLPLPFGRRWWSKSDLSQAPGSWVASDGKNLYQTEQYRNGAPSPLVGFHRLAKAACIAVILRRIRPLHGTDQLVALACISACAAVWAVAGRALSAPNGTRRGSNQSVAGGPNHPGNVGDRSHGVRAGFPPRLVGVGGNPGRSPRAFDSGRHDRRQP